MAGLGQLVQVGQLFGHHLGVGDPAVQCALVQHQAVERRPRPGGHQPHQAGPVPGEVARLHRAFDGVQRAGIGLSLVRLGEQQRRISADLGGLALDLVDARAGAHVLADVHLGPGVQQHPLGAELGVCFRATLKSWRSWTRAHCCG